MRQPLNDWETKYQASMQAVGDSKQSDRSVSNVGLDAVGDSALSGIGEVASAGFDFLDLVELISQVLSFF